MKIAFFSDLHIKSPEDEACQLFDIFCQDINDKKITHVILLGDMFDILIGEHKGYLKKYNRFFENILELLDKKIKVVFLEGNHDFHIKNTLETYFSKNSMNSNLFTYLLSGQDIVLGNKKYHYCHGYEVDYYNHYFENWKNIYTSKWFSFFVSYLLPYFFIEFLAHRASNNSKKRGKKVFNFEEAKNKYLIGAEVFLKEKKIDGVICGHTHIQENHEYEDGSVYINCGYPLKDKNYLLFNGTNFEFISLAVS
jgi:UDP-2,3-diacylglucosamine hydrolase